MINLMNLADVKKIQGDLRFTFESPSGQETMKFLEQMAGWYDFNEDDKDRILVAHGKRQLLASIKTLLKYSAEEIQAIARQQKEQ
jgi:hypothetical protein